MSLSKEKFFSHLYLFIDQEAFRLKRGKTYLTSDISSLLSEPQSWADLRAKVRRHIGL